jgi:Mrp family chromosome partitioning ATPase
MSVAETMTELHPRLSGIDKMVKANQSSPLAGLVKLAFGSAEQPARKSILITAAEPQAGVSWMATAVATELAASGRKVLLVDAEAIASLPTPEATLSRCHRIGSGRIWVLGQKQMAGAAISQPKQDQLEENLYELLEVYPHVVIDAPSLSVSDVALRFAPLVAGSVLVVREGKTETRDLVKACEKFSTLGGSILGCVYNAY